MAKPGVLDSDPAQMAARADELKKELQKLVNSIVNSDGDDYSLATIDQATAALKELLKLKSNKKKKSPLSVTDGVSPAASSCPENFKCPISNELMRDPVILSSGQTYDRPFIVNWLESGNRTCPKTKQVLSHTALTPNHLIREMISQWCNSHGFDLPDPIRYNNYGEGAGGITQADRDRFHSLINKLASSGENEAAKELRQLTKRMPSFRALFGEIPSIPQLLSTLDRKAVDPELQEDVITTLLNLSIHDNNKKLVAETPKAIPLIVEALNAEKIETRTNAAATLFTLSALDANKELIGKSGALKPLFALLESGNALAMKDSAAAIFNLCIVHENRARAVKEGGVRVILKQITEGILVNELLSILATLCSCPGAIIDIGELDGVTCLLRIVRESVNDRSKENAIAILYTVCCHDRTKWKDVKEEESTHGSITKLANDGTSRAKRKANSILDKFSRAVIRTHTA
ncbi:U-box domain-containing protein 9 [Linum grandiflorum]